MSAEVEHGLLQCYDVLEKSLAEYNLLQQQWDTASKAWAMSRKSAPNSPAPAQLLHIALQLQVVCMRIMTNVDDQLELYNTSQLFDTTYRTFSTAMAAACQARTGKRAYANPS